MTMIVAMKTKDYGIVGSDAAITTESQFLAAVEKVYSLMLGRVECLYAMAGSYALIQYLQTRMDYICKEASSKMANPSEIADRDVQQFALFLQRAINESSTLSKSDDAEFSMLLANTDGIWVIHPGPVVVRGGEVEAKDGTVVTIAAIGSGGDMAAAFVTGMTKVAPPADEDAAASILGDAFTYVVGRDVYTRGPFSTYSYITKEQLAKRIEATKE